MPNSPPGEGKLLHNQRQITLDPTTAKQQMAGLKGIFLDWANPNRGPCRHWTKEVVNLSAPFNLTQTQEQLLLHPYPRRLRKQTALPTSWSHTVTQGTKIKHIIWTQSNYNIPKPFFENSTWKQMRKNYPENDLALLKKIKNSNENNATDIKHPTLYHLKKKR